MVAIAFFISGITDTYVIVLCISVHYFPAYALCIATFSLFSMHGSSPLVFINLHSDDYFSGHLENPESRERFKQNLDVLDIVRT